MSEGFAEAGFEIAYGVDNDPWALETFHANHPNAEHDESDLAAVDDATLRRKVREVDVIVGGPCCQGFSTAGRHRKADWTERNGLWRSMYRAVALGRPRAFVLENVPGLEMAQDGTLSGAIVIAFADLGYVVKSRILLAADYGVPQLRRRVFVVGVRGRAKFEWPEAPYLGGWRRDTVDLWEARRREQRKHRHLTVADAIGDLPAIREGTVGKAVGTYTRHADLSAYAKRMRIGSKLVLDHEAKLMSDEHRELMAHVPQGGTWRDVPGHLLPDRFRGGMRRTDSTNLLGRLDPRRPAYTMTTQFDNVTCGSFTHPWHDRSLTIREAARFQSFPDRYEFHGDAGSKRRQVGNAVPPLLAQYLACALAEGMGAEPRRPRVILSRFEQSMPSADTLKRMRTQRRAGTKPEILVGTALRALGLSFRSNVKPLADLRREADIVFDEARVIVFVDGCFWHGCPEHSRPTKSKTKWWAEKIDANRARDNDTNTALRAQGFEVIRIWEHEDPVVGAAKIAALVSRRTA